MSVAITHGLRSSHKKFEETPVSAIHKYLTTNRDCYEITRPITEAGAIVRAGTNRVFVDIDGKGDAATLNDDIGTALNFALNDYSPSIMTASAGNKISFRITLPTHHGSLAAVRQFVEKTLAPVIVPALDDVAKGVAAIDYSVYSSNRKMRMWNSSKDDEDRPYRIFNECGTVADTLITVIPPTAELLPEPVASVAAVAVSETVSVASDPVETVAAMPAADASLLEKAVMGLGPSRFNSYNDWIRVGFICYNEGLPLALWERFSAQSPKYRGATECGKMWSGFRKSNLTQATLWKWLKEDNAALYAELNGQRSDVWRLLRCATHADTAQFFFSLKPDAYAYHEALGWYQLMANGIWQHYNKAPNGLMSDIWSTLKKFLAELSATTDFSDQSEEAKARRKLMEAFGKMIGTKSFVEGVIAFLPVLYTVADLDKLIDQTRNVFAFADGWCYDCDAGKWRPIVPTDWVSTTTGYAHPAASDAATRAELRRVLWSIFEDDAMTDYLLRITATCLHGRRFNEEFYLMEGKGRNGKGVFTDLVAAAFGDYYGVWDPTVLTKPTDRKDAPQSEIAGARSKRYILSTEPGPDEKIQTAIVKRLTGGDAIKVRALYSSPIEFRPQFGLTVQTNHLPKQDQPCAAFKARARRIVFPFVFTEDEPTQPFHRPMDKGLKERLANPKFRDEFVLMLIDAYRTIGADKSLNPPAPVREATAEWINGNNPVFEWLPTRYTMAPPTKDTLVSASELLAEFRCDTGTADREMTAEKFKGFMKALGVESVRKSAFKRSDGTECGAGSYYAGLARRVGE